MFQVTKIKASAVNKYKWLIDKEEKMRIISFNKNTVIAMHYGYCISFEVEIDKDDLEYIEDY